MWPSIDQALIFSCHTIWLSFLCHTGRSDEGSKSGDESAEDSEQEDSHDEEYHEQLDDDEDDTFEHMYGLREGSTGLQGKRELSDIDLSCIHDTQVCLVIFSVLLPSRQSHAGVLVTSPYAQPVRLPLYFASKLILIMSCLHVLVMHRALCQEGTESNSAS